MSNVIEFTTLGGTQSVQVSDISNIGTGNDGRGKIQLKNGKTLSCLETYNELLDRWQATHTKNQE